MNRIRVTRTIVIEGREDWVNITLGRSWVNPETPKTVLLGTVKELTRVVEPVREEDEIRN